MSDSTVENGKSFKQGDVEFNLVDDEYITKMTGFEVDCASGGGEPMACHNTGEFFSVVLNDRPRAKKVFEKNCNERDFGPSCFNLAKLYFAGKGVELNDDEAEKYFDKACKWGHHAACYHKGVMNYSQVMKKIKNDNNSQINNQNKKDLNKTLDLFKSTCKDGFADSCEKLASHYLSKGPDFDPIKAKPFLTTGCDKSNNLKACHNLAVLYKNSGDMDNFELYKQRYEEIKEIGGGFNSFTKKA